MTESAADLASANNDNGYVDVSQPLEVNLSQTKPSSPADHTLLQSSVPVSRESHDLYRMELP